jgi:putative tricarboxylic transport membrane protein
MFDGRPLAKQGRAGYAMAASFAGAFVSSILAAIMFTFFTIPFASVALRFGPPEMFAVLLIAFGTFVGLGGSPAKALIMLAAGFLLSTVGLDVVTGQPRLTFGEIALLQGFHFVPVTIGLYGVGEILFNASERYKLKIEEISSAAKLGLKDTIDAIKALWNHIWLAISSTLIGFIVGILPGVGATPATFICYGIARRTSRIRNASAKVKSPA